MLDMLFKNATVVDGTGSPPFTTDVAIANGKITRIGNTETEARWTTDASGLVLCPGFIDLHSHGDLMLLHEPTSPLKVLQGVTTEILGQDGIGTAPIKPHQIEGWRGFLSGVAGSPPVPWSWAGVGEYLEALEKQSPAVNVASLIPYGNVRIGSMELDSARPTPSHMAEIRHTLKRAMDEGAFGVSVGLIYLPACFSTQEELIEAFEQVGRQGGFMAIHMRNEGDYLLESLEEALLIARHARLPLHISHFKAAGKDNWHKYPLALERIHGATSQGIDISFDQYPYTAGSTMLMALLPTWALEGGIPAVIGRLQSKDLRRVITRQFAYGLEDPKEHMRSGWDNYVKYAGWDGILVTSVKSAQNQQLMGKTIAEISDHWGCPPEDALFDLLIQEDCSPSMAVFFQSEDNVVLGLKSAYQTVGTDGLLGGKPHPRAGGSYPRILGRYVREKQIISLPEAVRKMSGAPALRLALDDRGFVREGLAADLVLFDPAAILDTNSFADPFSRPQGIKYVVVNGVLTVEEGRLTGERGGIALKRG